MNLSKRMIYPHILTNLYNLVLSVNVDDTQFSVNEINYQLS